jgi:hypothetical protein
MQERDDFEDVNGGRGVNFLLVAQEKRKRKTKSVEKLRSLSLFRRRRHPRGGAAGFRGPARAPGGTELRSSQRSRGEKDCSFRSQLRDRDPAIRFRWKSEFVLKILAARRGKKKP